MASILSYGLICSIGKGTKDVLSNLEKSFSNINYSKNLSFDKKGTTLKKVAEVPYTNNELYNLVQNKSYINRKTDRSILLSMIAFEEAFNKLKLRVDYDKSKKIGIFCGTSVLETNTLETYYKKYKNNGLKSNEIKPILSSSQSRIIDTISQTYNINDYSCLVSTACSSSTVAMKLASQALESNKLDYAIVIGVDSLCELSYYGFYSLGALSTSKSSPFSLGDYGLTIGEGASAIILGDYNKTDKEQYLLSNVGLTSDAYNLTAPSPMLKSTTEAMKQASQNIDNSNLQYIIAHGTGTELNDKIESKSIQKLFQNPKVSSLKGQFGHCLGAAGGMNAVVSLLSMETQKNFPTLNFTEHRKGCELDYVPNKVKEAHKLDMVLSNSFGFGGNNASALILKDTVEQNIDIKKIDSMKIVISGVDALIPDAINLMELKNKILNCQYNIQKIDKHLSFTNKYHTTFGNKIDFETKELSLYSKKNLKNFRKMDRLSKLINIVSTRLMRDLKIKINNSNKFLTGLLFGTMSGPLEATREFYDLVLEKEMPEVNPSLFQNTVLNASLGYLSIEMNITGPSLMFANNEIGGGIALESSCNFLKSGELSKVIFGTADELDSSLIKGRLDLKHTISGDSRLNVSPFNEDYNGLYLGEGAISFIIESEENAILENRTPLAQIVDTFVYRDSHKNSVNCYASSYAIEDVLNKFKNIHGLPDLLVVNSSGLELMEKDLTKAIKCSDFKDVYVYSTMSLGVYYPGLSVGLGLYTALIALEENKVPGMPYANDALGVKITNKTIDKNINLVFVLNLSIGGHISIVAMKKDEG